MPPGLSRLLFDDCSPSSSNRLTDDASLADDNDEAASEEVDAGVLSGAGDVTLNFDVTSAYHSATSTVSSSYFFMNLYS